MAAALHHTFADRLNDALIKTLLRAGVKLGTASLLTVRGRKSGQPHTVPVLLVEQDGQRWLVAPYGVVQWVRNIRVAGRAILTRGRRSETISVTELPVHEAAPILKQYLVIQHAADIRSYFDVTKDAPLEAFEREAARHPVFKITGVEEPRRDPQ
ncbi:MAG TPA: nitroreductase family deazaflavin-dependent oxidoreductase [Ktedonobacterales bacterium]|jgi:deazaflavin-dependent oxidoreductase (nitroreductase family)|nr:nitroreductase family deazaflavin-dependent oxidoreductase [Ktedonobacterales bacterium]